MNRIAFLEGYMAKEAGLLVKEAGLREILARIFKKAPEEAAELYQPDFFRRLPGEPHPAFVPHRSEMRPELLKKMKKLVIDQHVI